MKWIAKPIADSSWRSLHDVTESIVGQFRGETAIAFILSPNPKGHDAVVVQVPKELREFIQGEDFVDLVILDIPGRDPAYYVRSEIFVHEPADGQGDDELRVPSTKRGEPL